MIHPAWQDLLSRLRQMLDASGLGHIAIREESEGAPLTFEQLLEEYGTINVDFDEYVTFAPVDPDWRVYRVEGAPPNEWIGRAELDDYQDTPAVSLSGEGKWGMRFAYDQGSLPADTFDDEATFLATLVDYLVAHFSDRVYTLRVSVHPGGHSRGRMRAAVQPKSPAVPVALANAYTLEYMTRSHRILATWSRTRAILGRAVYVIGGLAFIAALTGLRLRGRDADESLGLSLIVGLLATCIAWLLLSHIVEPVFILLFIVFRGKCPVCKKYFMLSPLFEKGSRHTYIAIPDFCTECGTKLY